MTNTDEETETMQTTEVKTLEVTDNNLRTQFLAAFNNRPEWAQSFTTKMIGDKVRVTYSDNNKFGVNFQEAWNYIERH